MIIFDFDDESDDERPSNRDTSDMWLGSRSAMANGMVKKAL
jgi:hypothetical protein